jgi:hypothetical protein
MSHVSVFSALVHCFRTLSLVVVDLVRLASLAGHSHSAQAAENLFLRNQLAMFRERKVTATFCTLYVFVILELGTRRILHQNVTAHPTPEWTLQQFREALPGDHRYRFLIHDRDSIFSKGLDQAVTDLGVRVLRTPLRAPMANSVCERFGGTLRRECLDYLIPIVTAGIKHPHYCRLCRPSTWARTRYVLYTRF